MKITILMPSFNEEESVGKTISSIPVDALRGMGYDTEIMIVDGGSNDNTVGIARSLGAMVICSEKGYGLQYCTGFEHASGEIICTADSDCSYPMEEIPGLISVLIRDELDFISTNRFALMDHESMTLVKKIGNRFLTFMTNILFSLHINDSQSGMWIFRKNILEGLKLAGTGMSLSQEIKIKAYGKYRAREIDSTYRKRVGKVKLRIFIDGLGNLFSLIRIRFSI